MILIASVMIIGASLLVWFFARGEDTVEEAILPVGEVHNVVLEDDGYHPKELHIEKGDAVRFSTSRAFEHWPASNLHPTHNIYAAFDAKRPLLPEETWQFQFIKAGAWEFHDHLNATFIGVIHVAE